MDCAGLSEVTSIVTDEALQRDTATPQDCFVAYWVRQEALMGLYISRGCHGVAFFNKADEKTRSLLADLGWDDDDISKEATTLRQRLGPERVHIPKAPDKGDCLAESCCKLLIFARAYGHQVKNCKCQKENILGVQLSEMSTAPFASLPG